MPPAQSPWWRALSQRPGMRYMAQGAAPLLLSCTPAREDNSWCTPASLDARFATRQRAPVCISLSFPQCIAVRFRQARRVIRPIAAFIISADACFFDASRLIEFALEL